MLSLGKFFIQSPEDLYDIKGSSCNWIREITTRWGYSTDNRDRSFSVWRSLANNLTSSFVELSELWTQMCWETWISRHFCETSRNFSQSLSPSRSRISHHSDIISHISEIFCKSNTSIDRGLSSCDGHVGCVSDQACSFHDRMHFTIKFNFKSWELIQYLSHFVSSLTTSDVDNTLWIRVFRQSLWDASFSTSESSRNSTSSSQNRWIKRIKNSLSGKKWLSSLNLLNTWSWSSNRPEMTHR